MIKVKPLEQISRRYAKKSIMAYLDGEKNTNWIIAVLRSSGVNLEEIKSIVNSLRGYGSLGRYKFLAEFVDLA